MSRHVGQYGIAVTQTSGAVGVDSEIRMDLVQSGQGRGRIEEARTETVFEPVKPGKSTGAISVLKKLEVQS
jgi:hypothetical protein